MPVWLCLIVSTAILAGLIDLAGHFELAGWATGWEYSPDLFMHRSFRYYTVFGVKVTPKRTEGWMSAVDQYLHKGGFVLESRFKEPRWRMARGYAPDVSGWGGGPRWMCQALGCWSGSDRWVKWSEQHPELAKVLWPQLVDWIRREQYYRVYCLFRITGLEQASTPQEVLAELRQAENMSQEWL